MQPAAIRDHFSSDEILLWFNEADTDCSGTLSPDEFFKWSLNNASQQHGADALAVAFNKYDRDGTGQLDAVEFGSACVELGFGVVANAIFKSLDHGAHRRHVTRPARHATHIVVLCVCVCVCVCVPSCSWADGSGAVSYHELLHSLTTSAPSDPVTKQMLSALVCSLNTSKEGNKAAHQAAIDTTGWCIGKDCKDARSVQAELQKLLRESNARVVDLIQLVRGSTLASHASHSHWLPLLPLLRSHCRRCCTRTATAAAAAAAAASPCCPGVRVCVCTSSTTICPGSC